MVALTCLSLISCWRTGFRYLPKSVNHFRMDVCVYLWT